MILAGILQGSPLSGTLFIFAVDPILRALVGATQNKGALVRACADVIGIVVRRLRDMQLVVPVFDAAEALALLTLKPRKCVLIPCRRLADDDFKESVCKWLAKEIPQWQHFNIRDSAPYLGFPLGPRSGRDIWIACLKKLRTRVEAIAYVHPPTSVAARLYNRRVVPLISYLAQFASLSKDILNAEPHLVYKLLHLPGNCFCGKSVHALQHAGGPHVMSLVVEAHAIASRAAIQTFTNWAEWLPKLERASENGPITRHLHGKWWPACYDSEPIAIFLRDRSSPAALEAIGQCQLASALT